jgi:uncharacterized protein (DUF697 family)
VSRCTEQHVANAKLLSDSPTVDMFARESKSGVAGDIWLTASSKTSPQMPDGRPDESARQKFAPRSVRDQVTRLVIWSDRRPEAATKRARGLAGFPLSTCALALRIWAAMMLALYAAFWLQLESASTATVTVGILALQTRGQTYQKAVYRFIATVIGVVASFVIAGLFPQTRVLFMVGFAGGLGHCVYVGGLFDGNRA